MIASSLSRSPLSAAGGYMARELACGIRLNRVERADSPQQRDMVAHVDGLRSGDAEFRRCMQPTLGDDMDHAYHECEHPLLGRT